MKLYSGFTIKGPSMRYVPASEARGRTEGFWVENDYQVTARYEGDVYWFGGPDGIIMAYISGRDRNGATIYTPFAQISFSGKQRKEQQDERTVWFDQWTMENAEIESIRTGEIYENYRPEQFSTSFCGYLNEVEENMYIKRERYNSYQGPVIVTETTYKPPNLVGSTIHNE